MASRTVSDRFFVAMTIFVALILELLPLPSWIIWLRPEWVLLISMYWIITSPNIVGLFSAFSIGILLDLSNGTLLGEHALAMIIITYFVLKSYQWLRISPLAQQTMITFLLILIYKLIIFIIQGSIGQLPHVFLYWLSAFVSALLWPWIFTFLHGFRRQISLL